MFGEDYIIGISDGIMDLKGRVNIPRFAKPEEGDKICVKPEVVDDEVYLKLFSYSVILEYLSKYINLRQNAKTLDEIMEYNSIIENYFKQFIGYYILDKQHRIVIPKDVLLKSSFINSKEQERIPVEFIGLGECLQLKRKNK